MWNCTIRLLLNVVADRFNAFTDVDGDSPYNKEHGRCEFKGERIPFGALVDFAPPPDTKIDA